MRLLVTIVSYVLVRPNALNQTEERDQSDAQPMKKGHARREHRFCSSGGLLSFGLVVFVLLAFPSPLPAEWKCTGGSGIGVYAFPCFPQGGGLQSVAIGASASQSWSITPYPTQYYPDVSWVTIVSGSTGTGNGTLVISLAPNSTHITRTALLFIAGVSQYGAYIYVGQDGIPCSLSISPMSGSFPASGGNGSITGTTASNCTWGSYSDTIVNIFQVTGPYINIAFGTFANVVITGSGTLTFTVLPNSGNAPRTDKIVVAYDGPNFPNPDTVTYTIAQAGTGGNVPPPPELVDPVPTLLGALTNQNLSGLANGGSVVKGVAADGVSEVVVRISAANVGDQFTLTLLNDQGQSSSSSSDDGGLGGVGQQNFSSQITTSAVSTPSGPMAFALYVAPTDFPRTSPPTITCGGVTGTDPQLACRFVTIQVQGPSGSPTPLPVTILRPPVVLIHGLWSDQSSWNNFLPLFGNGVVDSRFSVDRAGYGYSVGSQISSFSPPYPQALSRQIANAKANSLGFQYNASGSLGILSQVQSYIQRFKNGSNPAAVPVAAVQADIVAHSMGGNITRTLPLQQSFLSSNTFGHGPIHKVITIDTPHLGTPLATQLLSGNGCVGDLLASHGLIAFDNVTLNGRTVTGAVGDLTGDGFGGAMSQWLQNIANPGPHPLPMAVIAGVLNSANLGTLTTNQIAGTIRGICGVLFKNPLAVNLTPLGWPMEFGQPSDAIVPLSSQVNNLSICPACQSFGFVHSGGAEILGFSGPSVLPTPSDLSKFPSLVNQIPNQVIGLLNTPVTDPVFNLVNP
jgi:pimeloyl-ACP methyl ester carboxylesterase